MLLDQKDLEISKLNNLIHNQELTINVLRGNGILKNVISMQKMSKNI